APKPLDRCRQRGIPLERDPPHDWRRPVRGKVVVVNGQHGEVQMLDLRVGRVARDEVHLTVDERPIQEPQVHDPDLLEPQPVDTLEPRVPIGALLELVAERRSPLARARHRVRDRANARVLAADDEREGVVEPERRGPHEPRGRVRLPHACEHPLRIALRRLLQHRGQRRPRVLDVRVDLPGTYRRVADERPAEVEAPLGPEPDDLDRLREELAEDALLGEVLRADNDLLAAARATGEHQERKPSHRGGRSARSTAPMVRSAPTASSAAGSAPARIIRLSTIATPRKMNTPSPPAPIAAAIVATPIPTTVATRTPARMTLAASGSSTRTKSWRSVIPMPRPASRIAGSTPAMPVTVFRTTGKSP